MEAGIKKIVGGRDVFRVSGGRDFIFRVSAHFQMSRMKIQLFLVFLDLHQTIRGVVVKKKHRVE